MSERVHVVIMNEKAEVLGEITCQDFVLVGWNNAKGGEKTEIAVHQSDRGNLEHLEVAARLIARAMRSSASPLFKMVGQVIETALDKTIEAVSADAKAAEPR